MTDFRAFAIELAALDALPDTARLSTAEASKALAMMGVKYTKKTLETMRCVSTSGPRWVKIGTSVCYELGDLRAFCGLNRQAA